MSSSGTAMESCPPLPLAKKALIVRPLNGNPRVTVRAHAILTRLGFERRRRGALPRLRHYVRLPVPPSPFLAADSSPDSERSPRWLPASVPDEGRARGLLRRRCVLRPIAQRGRRERPRVARAPRDVRGDRRRNGGREEGASRVRPPNRLRDRGARRARPPNGGREQGTRGGRPAASRARPPNRSRDRGARRARPPNGVRGDGTLRARPPNGRRDRAARRARPPNGFRERATREGRPGASRARPRNGCRERGPRRARPPNGFWERATCRGRRGASRARPRNGGRELPPCRARPRNGGRQQRTRRASCIQCHGRMSGPTWWFHLAPVVGGFEPEAR